MSTPRSVERTVEHVAGSPAGCRAQSHVVGAVLLLGVTVIALGGLTATVGTVVEDQTARADVARVAQDLDDAVRPVETTGHRTGSVRFTAGHLDVKDRDLRVFDGGTLVAEFEADALVYESGDRRVATVAGAIARGNPGSAWLERDPPIAAGSDVVVAGAVRLNASGGAGGTGGVMVPIATNASHERLDLGSGDHTVAVETATPGPFARYAEAFDADVETRDGDGDGTPSVVVDFAGTRRGYLVVHDLHLEVGHG